MKTIDLTGQHFGRLTVLRRCENIGGRVAWECQCECGNVCKTTTKNLRNGDTQSCGCLSRRHPDIQIGNKYNLLTVKEKIRKNNLTYWVCQCDCGNITEVLDGNLKTSKVKSCGCLKRAPSEKRLDITGQKFGYLTAIEFNRQLSTPTRTYWKCQCECGQYTDILLSNLRRPDRYPSCGCQARSRGELLIANLLRENQIPYVQEYIDKTCINPKTEKPLRFDFYVDNSYMIEFDGKQHYQEGQWEDLSEIQYRDQIKNQWCEENNIPLIRIPYTKYDTLTIDDLLLPIDKDK